MNQMVSHFRNLFSPPPLPLPRERYRLRLGQAAERPDFAALLRTRQGLLAGDASPPNDESPRSEPRGAEAPAPGVGGGDGTAVASAPVSDLVGLMLDEEPQIEIAYIDELEVDEAPTERLNRGEVISIRLNEAFERARRDPDLIVTPSYGQPLAEPAPAPLGAEAEPAAADSCSGDLEAEIADILVLLEEAEADEAEAGSVEIEAAEIEAAEIEAVEIEAVEIEAVEIEPMQIIEIGAAVAPSTEAGQDETDRKPKAAVELTPVELDFEDLIFIDEVVGEVEAMRSAVREERHDDSAAAATERTEEPTVEPAATATAATLTALRVAVRRGKNGAVELVALPAEQQPPADALLAIVLPLTSADGARLAAMLGAD